MDAKQRYEMWLGSDRWTNRQNRSLEVYRVIVRRLRIGFIPILSLEQADFEALWERELTA